MRKGHIPRRMCAVCRTMLDKPAMVRLSCPAEGAIRMASAGPLAGRGLYLCRTKECIGQFLKGRRFRRRFQSRLDGGAVQYLENQLALLDSQTE